MKNEQKKVYITPEIKIIKLSHQAQLMDVSSEAYAPTYHGDAG